MQTLITVSRNPLVRYKIVAYHRLESEIIIPEYILLGQNGATFPSGFTGATMTVYTSPHVTSDTSHMLCPGAGVQAWARPPPVTWAVKLLRELEDHHDTRSVLLKRV